MSTLEFEREIFNVKWNSNSLEKVQVPHSHKRSPTNTVSYYQVVKPIFIMLRIFGRFPYNVNEEGVAPFSLLSWPFLYSLLYNIIWYFITLWAVSMIITDKIASSRSYDDSVFWVMLIIYIFQNITAPITYCIDAPKMIRYCNMWKQFEDLWDEQPVISLKRCQIVSIFVYAALPVCTAVVLMQTFLFANLSCLLSIPIATSNLLMLIHWVITMHDLKEYTVKLQKGLLKDICRVEIGHKRRVWLKIRKLVTEIGDATGASGLCFVTLNLLTFSLGTYGCFINMLRKDKKVWALLLGGFYFNCHVYLLADTAHRTTEEKIYLKTNVLIGSVTSVLISVVIYIMDIREIFDNAWWPRFVTRGCVASKNLIGPIFSQKLLMSNLLQLQRRSITEVHLIILTITMKKPVVQYLGVININRNTYAKWTSVILTYFIVCVQMKLNTRRQLDLCLTEPNINVTNYSYWH